MAPGNLIFIIRQTPHQTFKREKDDLHTTLQISLKEALLGFKKDLKHLDDRDIPITREKVSQPGDIIRVKGEGMPHHQSSDRGDLFVKLEIVFPTVLTELQKEMLRELFDKRSIW